MLRYAPVGSHYPLQDPLCKPLPKDRFDLGAGLRRRLRPIHHQSLLKVGIHEFCEPVITLQRDRVVRAAQTPWGRRKLLQLVAF